MTAANFPADLATELGYEGGLAHLANDPGGLTNLGVTRATLAQWLGRPATYGDVSALTPETVAPLYRVMYWNAIQGDQLPSGVDLLVFDEAINSGPYRAAVTLQTALGVAQDGHIGPETLRAASQADPADLIADFTRIHGAFYRSLPTFADFGNGWINRLNAVAAKATALASSQIA